VANLFRNAYYALEHYVASGYVCLVRSNRPFTHSEQAAASLAACDKALATLDVAKLGLLLDVRLAPLSTDARLHQLLVENTNTFARRFVRIAVLLNTQVGKLQTARVMRTHSSVYSEIFTDERAAVDYVMALDRD
jgi:hypothetical protein